jgi:hypothetical protein
MYRMETHIFTMFFNHPQKNQTGNFQRKEKKNVEHTKTKTMLKTRTTISTSVKKCSCKFFTSKRISAQSKVNKNLYKELGQE